MQAAAAGPPAAVDAAAAGPPAAVDTAAAAIDAPDVDGGEPAESAEGCGDGLMWPAEVQEP